MVRKIGTSLSETLLGTPNEDQIYGGGSNDLIRGFASNDKLFGEADNDHLDAGAGDDNAYGNKGNDAVYGNGGNDYLSGDAGDDTLGGGDGNDELYGGIGVDRLYGGNDDDRLFLSSNGDTMGNDKGWGGNGNDFLSTQVGDSPDGIRTMLGEAGDDTLNASSAGTYYLSGGEDADRFFFTTSFEGPVVGTINDFTNGEDVLDISPPSGFDIGKFDTDGDGQLSTADGMSQTVGDDRYEFVTDVDSDVIGLDLHVADDQIQVWVPNIDHLI